MIILENLAIVNIKNERRVILYKKYLELKEKKTGVSTSTLTNWKYGRYTPKTDKLKKLADYFGVPLETLLEEEGENRDKTD